MARQSPLMDEKTRNAQEALKGPKTQESSNPMSKYTSEMDETDEAES